MKKEHFILLFMLVGSPLLSCSKAQKTGEAQYNLSGVTLDSRVINKATLPYIKNEPIVDNTFGPRPSDVTHFTKKTKLNAVLAVNLGAGLNKTIGYVSVLKNLERYSIKPSIISGAGMGAVIASLYAVGNTPEHIEWKLFKLFSKLKGHRALSNDWLEKVSLFLQKEFKKEKIQSTNISLHIPLYDKKLRRLRYFSRGSLYNVLYANFIFTANSKRRFLSPLKIFSYDPNYLKKKGADIIVAYDVLGEKISFKNKSDYLFGIYAKASGQISRIVGHERHLLLSLESMELDTSENLQKYIYKSLISSETFSEILREDIKKWDPKKEDYKEWNIED